MPKKFSKVRLLEDQMCYEDLIVDPVTFNEDEITRSI